MDPHDGRPAVDLGVFPAVVLAVLVLLAAAGKGGFLVQSWAPPTVFALTALTVVFAAGAVRSLDRRVALALGLLWALVGWSLLSATWAGSKAMALQEGERAAFYAAVMTLPIAVLRSPRSVRMIGGALVGLLSALAVLTLVRLHLNGMTQFLAGRLDAPVDYRNASACLFVLPFWPLVVFAATRGGWRAARAAAFALATLGLGLAFLTQSRGVLIGLGAGAVVALALGPDRVRRAWTAVLCIVGVAAFSGMLLAPYRAFAAGHGVVRAADIAVAADALTVLTIVAAGVGLVLALLDSGLRVEEGATRLAGAGLAVIVAAAVVAGLLAVGNPVDYAQKKLAEFRNVQTTTSGPTRLTATGGQRYDIWRVAWIEWKSRPLTGVGQGSYPRGYYRLRRTDRNLTDPHSLSLKLLAETGVVGLVIFLGFIGAVVAGVAALWREASVSQRRLGAALLAAGAVVLGQAQVDWFWLIPGLLGLGFACLALGVVAVSPPVIAGAAPARGWPSRLAALGLAVVTVGAGLLFLSDFYIRRARADPVPAARLEAARTAQRLDPWSLPPLYLEASALETLGRHAAARGELQRALAIEPGNFVTLGLLGDLEARAGDRAAARRYYRRALALNPLDVGLRLLSGSGGRSR